MKVLRLEEMLSLAPQHIIEAMNEKYLKQKAQQVSNNDIIQKELERYQLIKLLKQHKAPIIQ